MFNIDVLTEKELIIREKQKKEKINDIKSALKDENTKLFIDILLNNMPLYLIDLLGDKNLLEFSLFAYKSFGNRALDIHYIKGYNEKNLNFLPPNHSLVVSITNDKPFIVDSVREYFFEIKFDRFYIVHPIINVSRDESGNIKKIDEKDKDSVNESVLFLFLENITSSFLKSVENELRQIYNELNFVTNAFNKMTKRITHYKHINDFLTDKVNRFLEWLLHDNFIFMGIKEIEEIKGNIEVRNFGIFEVDELSLDVKYLLKLAKDDKINKIDDQPIYINKYRHKSKIKRREYLDFIGLIKKGNNVNRFYIIVGLFTQDVVKASPFNIELLKDKLEAIVKHFNFIKESHDYKWLIELINNFPKTLLFNLKKDKIIHILNIMFSISIKNQVCVYWLDLLPQKHFYLFLAAPLENFSYETIESITNKLEDLFQSIVINRSIREDEHGFFYVFYHFYLLKPTALKLINEHIIKEVVYKYIKDWSNELFALITKKFKGKKSVSIYSKYKEAFSENYKSKTPPEVAVKDIEKCEKLKNFDALLDYHNGELVLKLYAKQKLLLTDLLPLVNNIGLSVFEEETFGIYLTKETYYIHTFFIANIHNKEEFLFSYKKLIEDLVVSILKNSVVNDRLNSLVILSKLSFREIDFLRGVREFLEQLNLTVTRTSINNALINNPVTARALFDYIEEKFSINKKERKYKEIENKILKEIDKVESLYEDQILRQFLAILKSILRTNFFMSPRRNCISYKIDSQSIDFMPSPKPLYEIYVHAFRMKGVHLRAGKIARGGIRLSDRADDFRSEILGLMKTQIVKNSIIVPTGAKGGFVVEKANYEPAVEYRKFISSLLDITDNYRKMKRSHPSKVIRYDDFDPYLVVAADKGTGSFSDIANNISNTYNFWLKDAFASGGSNGYDHKKLGITARGAWESVKRHFLELGKDINNDTFTAIGIGDMSGDVFGNGMLLSNKIKLLAAFNHKHIFLDPTPDPEISFNERIRLFKLPKSSWDNYNKDLISAGGSVFRRDVKRIQLTSEIQNMLNTKETSVSGEKLISLILKMDVDLLYNGGIGTYVKDNTENNSDVGDPNNDNVRINANELRAKVVCEGGNLGFTQKARIAYALNGGKINTDALDNSAGVDTSDHEVNIKILLNNLVEHSIIDENKKNELIQEVTDDVVKSVLHNNYEQNLSVSLDLERAKNNYVDFTNTANFLSEKDVLDLEESNILFCQENRSPVRPELATLLGYSKIYLYNEILAEIDLINPLIKKLYIDYFPDKLRKIYSDKLLKHQLSKNIAAIMLINFMINKIGLSCIFNLFNLNKHSYFTLLYNYYRAFISLNLDNLWNYIESLDNIAISTKYDLLIFISSSIKDIADYSYYDALFNNFNLFKDILNRLSDNTYKNILNTFQYQNITDFPEEYLKLLESLFHVEAALDIFQILIKNKASQEEIINTYYLITELFNINALKNLIYKLSVKNVYEYENIMLLTYKLKELHKLLVSKFLGKEKEEIENILEKKYPYYRSLQKEIDCLIEEKADKLSAYYNLIDKLYLSFKG